MTVTILKNPSIDDWCEVKRRALITIGKEPVNPPDDQWKVKMLRCRHSPIRFLSFSFLIKDIPYWLHVEFVRHHVGIQFYVKSSRDDRANNDIPRSQKPQGSLVNMIVDVNADALMTIMAKRLCGSATKEMQELMIMIRREVLKTNPEFRDFLVPACMHTKGCNEFYPCGATALFFTSEEIA